MKNWFAVVALAWLSATAQAGELIEHRLEVELYPEAHRLSVKDTIVLPEGHSGPVAFRLHPGLEPRVLDPGVVVERARLRELARWVGDESAGPISAEYFEIDLPSGVRQFTLQYEGSIHHPVRDQRQEYARSFGVSPGLIGPEGVFLAGTSLWYPQIDAPGISFHLDVRLPAGWRSVSQGERLRQSLQPESTEEAWSEASSQEEIYLIAAPYSEYRQAGAGVEAMVFLRSPDAGLARKYLDATVRYVEMYRELIGPYPYSKFALVENFWETGYGMPSFTLLGPKVIRLPFIIVSSYPHEILHNWWGNGVYVDYGSGNWSEGLTSYLADHLLKEQRGEGADYRRVTLQGYADYVREGKDFPLTEFRARHSSSTQAVGYGKSLMLFHMLRREIGDSAFVEGLRRFYREHRYRTAGFADLEKSFSAAASRSLEGFFDQWVKRTGAPVLRVAGARAEAEGEGYRLTGTLEQVQGGAAYALSVPLAVTLEGEPQAWETRIDLRGERTRFELLLPGRPLRLDVDPDFDVFRRLDRDEIPPALSQALGAERALIVLPGLAPAGLLESYRGLAATWGRGRTGGFEVTLDSEIETLPPDRAVWLLGWENRFRPILTEALGAYPFSDGKEGLVIAGEQIDSATHSVVAAGRHPGNPDQALVWVASANAAAVPGLARKLPHYGKYSYLAFAGDEPTNTLKGQWPVVASPLVVQLAGAEKGGVPAAKRATREPLAQLPPDLSEERMRGIVEQLSTEDMEGRGFGSDGLERAAELVAVQFAEAGLRPGGDGAGDWFQRFPAEGGPNHEEKTLRNVIGIVPGSRAEWSGQAVVIGAHYDHLGRGWPDVHQGDEGRLHPGADDNASGVAVLLELARYFARAGSERTLVFAAFSGEEAGRLGSRYFVRRAAEDSGQSIRAMINLDTVGRLGERELLVLGTGSAREWEHIFRGAGYVAGVQVRGVADDLGSSDQKSFLDVGIPAVQLFAGAHADYHRASDTADKLDAAGLVKVGKVAKEAIEYLGQRPEPLSSQPAASADQGGKDSAVAAGRRVSLGTVPDFAFAGHGVRLDGVGPGSPAELAGLAAGDVIVAIGSSPVAGLRDFAQALRGLEVGETIRVRYLRDGAEREVEASVVSR